jgi:hypothetical protein
MLTTEQKSDLITQCQQAAQTIRRLSASLTKAAQTINEQVSTIETLSKDNLALVAKLDELTGRNTPGTGFQA